MTSTSAVTPYAAAKIVNAALLESGVEKVLPPQMFYNYTTARIRGGKKPLIACTEDGKILTTALAEWLERYVAKQTTSV